MNYPNSFKSISSWASEYGVSVQEARFRFAQFGVLNAIANSRVLSATLVFKGGNALDFVWEPNRSTKDLDFSARDSDLQVVELRKSFNESLGQSGRQLGIAFRVQRMEQQPPGPNKSFITFEGTIGYALQDEAKNNARIQRGENVPSVIPVDISINEPICEASNINVDGTFSLQVCTLEDIVAEKLRALLQQVPRNRTRCQDLLDIAVILQGGHKLNRVAVAKFLILKASARNIDASKHIFRTEEIKTRAMENYAQLASTARKVFVPFDEAYSILMGFVAGLALPE